MLSRAVLIARVAWPVPLFLSSPAPAHTPLMDARATTRARNPLHPFSFLFRLWPVIIARGTHPFPSRTRSLSLAARMVLPGRPGGRVRRHRPLISTHEPSVPRTVTAHAAALRDGGLVASTASDPSRPDVAATVGSRERGCPGRRTSPDSIPTNRTASATRPIPSRSIVPDRIPVHRPRSHRGSFPRSHAGAGSCRRLSTTLASVYIRALCITGRRAKNALRRARATSL